MYKGILEKVFTETMTWLARVMVLNVLLFLTSMPLITVGAAQYAGFQTVRHLKRSKDESLFHLYLHYFREGFSQSTLLWLLQCLLGGTCYLSWSYAVSSHDYGWWMVGLALTSMMAIHFFQMQYFYQAFCGGSVRENFRSCFLFFWAFPGKSLFLMMILCAPIVLMQLSPIFLILTLYLTLFFIGSLSILIRSNRMSIYFSQLIKERKA